MASTAQLRANQANAKLSTGPKSITGKQQSAKNSLRHGLNAAPDNLFASHPNEQTRYNELKTQLRLETLPHGIAEEVAFEQYAFSSFQSLRAQSFEVDTQNRWLAEPTNQQLFLQMERAAKLSAQYERRATKAFKQLQDLQLHRLAAVECQAELAAVATPVPISTALPLATIRTKQLAGEDALLIGLTISAGLDQTTTTNPIPIPR